MKLINSSHLISMLVFFILLNVNQPNPVAFAQEEIEFDYTGIRGPAFWDLLSESSKICRTGTRQSPIDITTLDLAKKKKPPITKFLDAENVEMINNGNTVQVFSENSTLPATIISSDDGSKYQLEQFHFHTPSEHRVNGKHHDVEQHLVFKKVSGENENEIAVVAVFYDIGDKENKFLDPIIQNIPRKMEEKKTLKKVMLSMLLKDINHIKNAFNYDGSLTTPPCTETVEWYVNKKALKLSVKQFSTLRDVTGFNSRFTQLRSTEHEKTKMKKRSLDNGSFFKLNGKRRKRFLY